MFFKLIQTKFFIQTKYIGTHVCLLITIVGKTLSFTFYQLKIHFRKKNLNFKFTRNIVNVLCKDNFSISRNGISFHIDIDFIITLSG